MGGTGSGNWYRAGKKTTTGECHSVDVRYVHRHGLLKAGRWFSLRWTRGDRETGSIRGIVGGETRPERVILTYRHRAGSGEEWEEVREPVLLEWTPCSFGGERPWFICPGARDAVGGSPSFTGRGDTSCAAIVMASRMRASAKAGCTALSARRKAYGRGSGGART